MSHGRFPRQVGRRDIQTIRDDSFVLLRVMRGRRGEETQVFTFKGRVSGTSSGSMARDNQKAIASTSSLSCVISAPPWASVKRGDEIWTPEDARYRVIAVDTYPGQKQLITEQLQ